MKCLIWESFALEAMGSLTAHLGLVAHTLVVESKSQIDLTINPDQCNVDMFEVFSGRVVNGTRGLGAARRESGEQENCGYGSAQQVQTD
jgi:hypothetical protein